MRKALFAALFLVLGFAATAQKFDKKYLKSPIFDRAYYLKTHLDVATAGVSPEKHWEGNGFKEGRASSPVFDAKYYLANNKTFPTNGVNWLTTKPLSTTSLSA